MTATLCARGPCRRRVRERHAADGDDRAGRRPPGRGLDQREADGRRSPCPWWTCRTPARQPCTTPARCSARVELIQGVRGVADDRVCGAQDGAPRRRQVLLTDVDARGPRQARHVGAVVHDHAGAERSAGVDDRDATVRAAVPTAGSCRAPAGSGRRRRGSAGPGPGSHPARAATSTSRMACSAERTRHVQTDGVSARAEAEPKPASRQTRTTPSPRAIRPWASA